MNGQILGYRADCRERFNRGETVAILASAGHQFLFRIVARKRGVPKRPVEY